MVSWILSLFLELIHDSIKMCWENNRHTHWRILVDPTNQNDISLTNVVLCFIITQDDFIIKVTYLLIPNLPNLCDSRTVDSRSKMTGLVVHWRFFSVSATHWPLKNADFSVSATSQSEIRRPSLVSVIMLRGEKSKKNPWWYRTDRISVAPPAMQLQQVSKKKTENVPRKISLLWNHSRILSVSKLVNSSIRIT